MTPKRRAINLSWSFINRSLLFFFSFFFLQAFTMLNGSDGLISVELQRFG